MQAHPLRIALWMLLLCALGCSNQGPSLTEVRGRIFFRGEPLKGGHIVYTPNPDRGGSGPLARAEIESDGTYLLRTGEAAGAAPGWYRVSILAMAKGEGHPQPLVPAHYASPELSQLECHVQAGKDNVHDFRLD